MSSVRRIALCTLVVVLVAGCAGTEGGAAAGDGGTSRGAAEDGGAAGSDDPAVLGVIVPGVDVADEPADIAAATFRSGEDGEGLVVGDAVRTDEEGFAEVIWFDGALARVDVDSLYELVELDASPGTAIVRTELEVGRIWNRLRADEVQTYEVATDVAIAAVRGTAFWVSCLTVGCTFAVFEGAVQLDAGDGTELELTAGQQVDVDEDGVPGAVVAADYGDPWVARNAALDEEAGFDPLAPPVLATGGCPFDAPPDGWVEEPATDGPAADWCRYVNPDADSAASFAVVEWYAAASQLAADTIEQNRPFYEQFRDEVAASDCAQGSRDVFVAYDEPVGDGALLGYAWRVARGPFTGGTCIDGVGNSDHGIVIDGQAFRMRGPEGVVSCTIADPGNASAAEWDAHLDCIFGVFEDKQAAYRALAAELLGG